MVAHRIARGTRLHVAGIQVRVDPGPSPLIQALWKRMNPHVCGKPSYGVCYDMKDGMYSYLVAIEVEEGSPLPDADWVTLTIPEADFAVFDHTGSIKTIGATWAAIMQSTDINFDCTIPNIEKYPAGFTCDGGLTIWIAIKTMA
ncbi:Aste57867_15307 [Aphanomyces stellatus]|uniref:Aste57867_15307 protein n=1 Tax=Aphanomyces stellatus TaxID=120398 RepID=A0A485L2V8_9STRA|nr:hypothetical protein As57867_015251 [Aphanomyces stellatus]VFT92116.1 Aste57867_15307 [Aphanomyces stellatus]